jgi:TolB-like protein
LLIAAALSLWLLVPKAGGDVLDSIAVLPLENISGDPEQENFADVLTIQVTADLYKISALRVIPPESVRGYKKSEKPLKEIAKELNVKAILSGSVLRSRNRVRLIVRLIDPVKDRQIWAETFEKEMGDIYFLQSELSQAIVSGVKVYVSPQEKVLLASAREVIPEANDLYFKAYQAVWLSGDWNLKTVMRAIDYLEQAVKIDLNYAQAYADLGGNYYDLAANGLMPAEEAYPKAEAAALKALELDHTLAAPHGVLGWIKLGRDWDFSGAEQGMKKAIELEPGNYDVQWSYNVFINLIGRSEEAIARAERLEESKPAGFMSPLAFFYLCAGRYKEGLEEAKKAAEKNPGSNNNLWLVLAYGLNGMHTEALSLMNEIMTSADARKDSRNISMLAWILAHSGQREEALATMEKLKTLMAQMKTNPSVSMAGVYAALGDKDKALELLNSAYEKREPSLLKIRSFPEFHNLRGDPRFKDLLKKIGLE